MADFTRRALPGIQGLLQGDIEEAFNKVRGDVDGKQSASYTPATAGDWAAPPPTTIQEAIDRLVAAVKAGSTSV